MPRIAIAFALLCLLLPATTAHAWRPLGHRLVALLAEPQLTPTARDAVRHLLASGREASLADVANWADTLRDGDPALDRRTARWHFVNIGENGCRYDAARDCPGGDCVVEAIRTQAAILGDRARPDAERLQALKFVVHFVGDVHQPLHAGYGRDRGGNTVQVAYRGVGTNLHALWDHVLLASRGLDETGYLSKLDGHDGRAAPASADDAAAWAEESCRIVQQPGFYPERARIGERYIERHRPIAEAAIQRAGQRLAGLLNDALG